MVKTNIFDREVIIVKPEEKVEKNIVICYCFRIIPEYFVSPKIDECLFSVVFFQYWQSFRPNIFLKCRWRHIGMPVYPCFEPFWSLKVYVAYLWVIELSLRSIFLTQSTKYFQTQIFGPEFGIKSCFTRFSVIQHYASLCFKFINI